VSVSSQPIPSGFSQPGRSTGLLDVFRRRYLLSLLVRKEVQVRYRGSVLGWLWSYVKPTAQFVVFFLALGVFLRLNQSMPSYPIYLFSGLIVINLFTEAFSNGTRSLVDNGALIKKIYLPREMFPVASTIVAFVNFLPQALVTLVVCLVVGWAPQPLQIAGILLGMLIIVVLATGLGMLFGSANVSFRDSQNFVELITLVATWVSPILYPWTTVRDILPDWLLTLYLLNPVTTAVELFHAGFWFPTTDGSAPLPPDLLLKGLAALGIAALVLVIGQTVFRRLEGRFAQDL
jgi:ABC-2 type transport system permease protein